MARILPSQIASFLAISSKDTINITSFLDMIAWSEGTADAPQTRDCGYDILVGGARFASYADHPNIVVQLPNLNIASTAAGRYQILSRYWIVYKKQLHLPDFSPVSQDWVALQLIRECKAVTPLISGQLNEAIKRCSSRWASLPGNEYGQHMHRLEDLAAHFSAAGGRIYS